MLYQTSLDKLRQWIVKRYLKNRTTMKLVECISDFLAKEVITVVTLGADGHARTEMRPYIG